MIVNRKKITDRVFEDNDRLFMYKQMLKNSGSIHTMYNYTFDNLNLNTPPVRNSLYDYIPETSIFNVYAMSPLQSYKTFVSIDSVYEVKSIINNFKHSTLITDNLDYRMAKGDVKTPEFFLSSLKAIEKKVNNSSKRHVLGKFINIMLPEYMGKREVPIIENNRGRKGKTKYETTFFSKEQIMQDLQELTITIIKKLKCEKLPYFSYVSKLGKSGSYLRIFIYERTYRKSGYERVLYFQNDVYINSNTKTFCGANDENAILLHKKGDIKGVRKQSFSDKAQQLNFRSKKHFNGIITILKWTVVNFCYKIHAPFKISFNIKRPEKFIKVDGWNVPKPKKAQRIIDCLDYNLSLVERMFDGAYIAIMAKQKKSLSAFERTYYREKGMKSLRNLFLDTINTIYNLGGDNIVQTKKLFPLNFSNENVLRKTGLPYEKASVHQITKYIDSCFFHLLLTLRQRLIDLCGYVYADKEQIPTVREETPCRLPKFVLE